MFRIVVDAMGGDHAPEAIVAGAAEASLHLDAELILVGDEPRIAAMLPTLRYDAARLRIHHASQAIGMDESAGRGFASKPDASITVAAKLIRTGQGDAVVSAGNTGASVLAFSRHVPLIEGVRRSALAAVYPTELRHGERDDPFALILDVGATIDATADDLVSFAVMGASYARIISKNRHPKVALLSNGAEAGKGPRAVVDAHTRLAASDLNFIGNIEGVDIPRGVADVVVCAGFVGNVVLKMLEGVSETVLRLARYAHKERLTWRLGLYALSSAIDQMKAVTDWRQYGGAPLLGFSHPCIKAHGRSNPQAIHNAIRVAHKALVGGLCPSIATELASLEPRP